MGLWIQDLIKIIVFLHNFFDFIQFWLKEFFFVCFKGYFLSVNFFLSKISTIWMLSTFTWGLLKQVKNPRVSDEGQQAYVVNQKIL